MTQNILIISYAGDPHAHAVAEALRRKGAEPVLWYTPDFPMVAGECVRYTGGQRELFATNVDLGCGEGGITSVWNRRPQYSLDDAPLHPHDVEFARLNCEDFRDSLLASVCPDALWVNPYEAARRTTKMTQHAAAVAVGLRTPDTLYGNDPDVIRQFIRDCGGQIVYKPLIMMSWRIGGDTHVAPYTAVLTEDMLVDDDLLRAVPGIYQAVVPKQYELRITVIGDRVVGTAILSQQTERGRMDWRRAYAELRMEPADIPPALADRCVALLRRLGLVFGCIDVIVTPDGDHVFLEVNQMGQFLFLEEATGQPLLDMFCELLIQGRPDFAWSEAGVTARFADVRPAADARRARDAAAHPPPPQLYIEETAATPDDDADPATAADIAAPSADAADAAGTAAPSAAPAA